MFYTIFFNNQLCIKILNNVTVLLKPVYAVRPCIDKGSFLKMTSFRRLVSLEFLPKSVHFLSLSGEAIECVPKLNKPRLFSKPGSQSDRAAVGCALATHPKSFLKPRNLR